MSTGIVAEISALSGLKKESDALQTEGVEYTCMSCNKTVSDIESHLKVEHNIQSFHVLKKEDDANPISGGVVNLNSNDVKTELFDDADDVLNLKLLIGDLDGYLDECEYEITEADDARKTSYACKSCSLTFETFVDLKHHSIILHDAVLLRRDCRHCVVMFDSHRKFLEHLKLHQNGFPKRSDKSSSSIRECSKKHGVSFELGNQMSFNCYQCKDCRKTFKQKPDLLLHYQTEHSLGESSNDDDSFFWCDNCNLNFSSLQDLRRHGTNCHDQHHAYSCLDCDTDFQSKGSLNLHNVYHHRIHRCSTCNIAFPGRLALTSHVKLNHPGMPVYRADSRFVCEYCSQPFSIRSQLSDHIQSVHLGLINQCEECGKVLSTSETLKVHRLKHKPEMHRTCEHCGRQFYRTGMLTEHIRASHPEALPDDWRRHTTCPYCQSHFTRRESMRRHIEAKHEPKSLACAYCERRFTCRRYLVRHENKHHLGKPTS